MALDALPGSPYLPPPAVASRFRHPHAHILEFLRMLSIIESTKLNNHPGLFFFGERPPKPKSSPSASSSVGGIEVHPGV
jgi:hypothetical protein